MIRLHRLKGEEFWLNHRLIETVEMRPDTVISLNNEHKYIVREKPDEIQEIIQLFENKIFTMNCPTQSENK